ncbi:hypothetical protein Taro_007146 [Colocasia esculenta]|uniref:SCP domain-containing protein n=1 Tax=Colocasia esculenta TaxID=4460 RepID=A0A843TYX2_COLES|nr:hypothetical protein [Colocasia esculenta]
MWENEKQYYDYASNSCIGEQVCRHYTQVVWADTKRVGCGHAKCDNGVDIVVCNYDPSGNVGIQWPYAIFA